MKLPSLPKILSDCMPVPLPKSKPGIPVFKKQLVPVREHKIPENYLPIFEEFKRRLEENLAAQENGGGMEMKLSKKIIDKKKRLELAKRVEEARFDALSSMETFKARLSEFLAICEKKEK